MHLIPKCGDQLSVAPSSRVVSSASGALGSASRRSSAAASNAAVSSPSSALTKAKTSACALQACEVTRLSHFLAVDEEADELCAQLRRGYRRAGLAQVARQRCGQQRGCLRPQLTPGNQNALGNPACFMTTLAVWRDLILASTVNRRLVIGLYQMS